MYVEIKDKQNDHWRPFGKKINPGRVYGMFAKLADVRNGWNITPICPPRGVPNEMAYEAWSDYHLYVTDDPDDNDAHCSKDQAEKWVSRGSSKYARDNAFVTNPDWHSASWLTPDEYEKAINELWENSFNRASIEYVAVLDLLRSFERQGMDARIVFWFDN